MHLRSTFAFLNSSFDVPSQCTWNRQLPREVWSCGGLQDHQRVRGLYSGSFLIFSFSVSLSSRAITRECA